MQAILVTKDLMFSSRVQALAKQHEVPLKVTTRPEAVQSALKASSTDLIAVDLEAKGLSPLEWLELIAAASPNAIKKIAYAPHGQVQKIKEAREAGFDQVLTRGQFDSNIESILHELVS